MNITVYTKPNCVQCDATKRWLTKNDIPFETKDLSESEDLVKLFLAKGFMAAPIVETDYETWSGFRASKLEALAKEFKSEEAHKDA